MNIKEVIAQILKIVMALIVLISGYMGTKVALSPQLSDVPRSNTRIATSVQRTTGNATRTAMQSPQPPTSIGSVKSAQRNEQPSGVVMGGVSKISTKKNTTQQSIAQCISGSLSSVGPMELGPQDSGRTIKNVHIINSSGNCITIKGAKDITIEDSLFQKCKVAIFASDESASITVRGNRFEDVGSAMKFWSSDGGGFVAQYNEYKNLGVVPQDGGANFIELNDVHGSGIILSDNIGECDIAQGCDTEDLISIFKSSGTAEHPILVERNRFRGRGPSESGSGIMTGDYGGGYITVRDNILVYPGQAGMGIAGGTHITIENNVLFHDKVEGITSSAGIVVGNWGGGSPCNSHRISGNRIYWYSSRGGGLASWWPYGNDYDDECSKGTVTEGNVPQLDRNTIGIGDESLSANILPKDLFANLAQPYFSACHR